LSVTPFAPPVQNSKVEHFVISHFPDLEGWGTDRRKKNSFRQEVTGHKRCFKQGIWPINFFKQGIDQKKNSFGFFFFSPGR
jgi:hypothetical protein